MNRKETVQFKVEKHVEFDDIRSMLNLMSSMAYILAQDKQKAGICIVV